jgi:glutamine amidotransferase
MLWRLGVEAVVTAEAEVLQKADMVIFPGQGEASTTMQYLLSTNSTGSSKT